MQVCTLAELRAVSPADARSSSDGDVEQSRAAVPLPAPRLLGLQELRKPRIAEPLRDLRRGPAPAVRRGPELRVTARQQGPGAVLAPGLGGEVERGLPVVLATGD